MEGGNVQRKNAQEHAPLMGVVITQHLTKKHMASMDVVHMSLSKTTVRTKLKTILLELSLKMYFVEVQVQHVPNPSVSSLGILKLNYQEVNLKRLTWDMVLICTIQ